MFKKMCSFSVLMLLVALPAWGLDLKPGKYEITAKVEMPGMPAGMAPQTTTQCLDELNPVPNSSAAAQGCKIIDMKTKGNTVTYTMECTQQGMKIKTTGKITYNGDSFEGTSQTSMGPSAGGMTVKTTINGKRIGECD
ncbi:MAG: DUF3617 family protein [Desulfatiglans sp.]|jgi:hypothetical protein|nr:DUF3617 family protein [Thermodesulfobacteriota bacterium]MEE4354250.1 DUF3617 family protein [Desulfatiglans sp.]